jgi:hypothetical protein
MDVRLPQRGECFVTSNGRHQLVWSRLVERRHSICFPQVYDGADPEPLPGSRRGKRFFLKLAHPGKPDSATSIRTEAALLKLPEVRECRAVAELIAEGEWEGLPFVVKRQVPGPTLAQALADRVDLPAHQVGRLLHEMALAAEACRKVGYCVADWSPTNVNVLGGMLLDLGGAVRFDEEVRYAREESPDRGLLASPAVDVRGVCMLALDVYGGEALARLRGGEENYEQAVALLRDRRPSECPADLWEVIVAGLGGRPGPPLDIAADLLHALSAWRPAEPPPPPPPKPRRRGLLGRVLGREK